jgi:hypothetical protein
MAVSNGPTVVTSGLVLSLDAADRNSYPGSGTTWTDMSGNGNNATLVNSPAFSSASGGAIALDGIDDSVSLQTFTFTNLPYTLEFFGKITGTLDTSNRRSIFANFSFASEFSNTNTFFTNITVDSVATYFNFGFSTAGSIVVGNNFHWVFTLNDSKQVYQYLNNVKTAVNTQLTSYTTITSTIQRFGASGLGRYFVGNLYCARIYNKALTDSEVVQNYNASKTRFGL